MQNSTLYAPDQDEQDEQQPTDAIARGQHERTEQASHIRDMESNAAKPGSRQNDALDPENLSDAEQNQSNGQAQSNAINPMDRLKSKVIDDTKKKIIQKLGKRVRSFATPKRLLIGGGILSGLVILAIMASGFSAFELINLRQNAVGHGNRYMNRVLERRRAKTLYKMLYDSHGRDERGITSEENVKRAKAMKRAFEREGFKVEIDEKSGAVKEFGFTNSKTGEYKTLDLDAHDSTKAVNDFFGSSKDNKFGLEASKAFDKVDSVSGATWRGPAARLVYGAYKFAFFNWLDRKPKDPKETPQEQFADDLRQSNATEEALTAENAQSKEALGDGQQTTDEDGNKSTTEVTNGADVLNGSLNNNVTPAEYQDQMLKNPKADDSILGVKTNSAEQLVDDTSKALDGGGVKSEEALGNFAKGAFKGSLHALVKSFNALGYAQEACEVKGILNFVANYRNIVISIELARFAIRMLNASDDQQAGILSGEALNLVMIYLTTPSPTTGRGHTGAGGEQFMFGDTKARPGKFFGTLYGVGRNNDGILGTISSYVNDIPGINHCKVVQNGVVSTGGLAVGIVASIGSGFAETAANLATILTLAAMHEIVVQTATSMLIKGASHMLLNGQEKNGELAGNAFASGFDSLTSMVGGANAAMPSTNAQIAGMNDDVNAYERSVAEDQSVFERYFSPSNSNSLSNHIAMALPGSFHAAVLSFGSGLTGVLHSMTSFSFIGGLLPGNNKAYALDSGCTDPQVKALNVATDPFCNPIMARIPDLDLNQTQTILRSNEQIDDKGNPTATKSGGGNNLSFSEYRDLCMAGRPGASLLYNPSPAKDGSDNPNDDRCMQHGDPLPGDNVGRYDRFIVWYGYKNDTTSIDEHLGVSSADSSDTSYQTSGSANATDDTSDPNVITKPIQ